MSFDIGCAVGAENPRENIMWILFVIIIFPRARNDSFSAKFRLGMASRDDSPSLSVFITLEEIANVSPAASESALLKLIAEARLSGYRSVCVPLTTGKWKERWAETCLLPVEQENLSAENASADHRAEIWRSNPAFELGEVTMTRLGMQT